MSQRMPLEFVTARVDLERSDTHQRRNGLREVPLDDDINVIVCIHRQMCRTNFDRHAVNPSPARREAINTAVVWIRHKQPALAIDSQASRLPVSSAHRYTHG